MAAPADDIAAATAVAALLSHYAECIDAGALERWPDFFTDDGLYKITTAENYARGLPIGIILADSRAMRIDRVQATRKANIYEPQRYRHIVSTVRIIARDGDMIEAQASFLVVRIMGDGAQDLFVTGRYLDRIDFSGAEARFAEKLVVLDSDKIDTLIAIPL